MGLFDDLFGSKQTTTSNTKNTLDSNTTGQQSQSNQTNTNQSTNQTQKQNTSSATDATTNQSQAGANVTSSLDAGTIGILTDLLKKNASIAGNSVGGTANSDFIKNIAQTFLTKGTTGDAAAVKAATDASVAKSKLDFETGEGQQVAGIQQQVGSKNNSFSELIQQKGQNDLTTQIANIVAQGELQASSLSSADLGAAVDAMVKASSVAGNDASATLNPVLQIAALLKGAQTQSSDTSTGTSSTSSKTTEQQIADIISQITGSSTGTSDTNQSGTLSQVGNTTGNEQTKGSKGIIGDILSIF